MDLKTCKDTPNCLMCKDAVLISPKGFKDFHDVVGVYGLWDALCIAEVVCPYKLLISELQKGGGLNG